MYTAIAVAHDGTIEMRKHTQKNKARGEAKKKRREKGNLHIVMRFHT